MEEGTPVPVLLGRFDDLVGRGLQAFLEEDEAITVVARDVAPEDLGPRLVELRPRVAVLELEDLRSAADVHHVRAAHPATDLVVLADRPTHAQIRQVLAFGARACLDRRSPAAEVLHAVHAAARGMATLPRSGESQPAGRLEVLTPRESGVLELLQQDRSNAEIARNLHVGVETVRTHRRHIYRKLGVRTRRELAELTAPVRAEGSS